MSRANEQAQVAAKRRGGSRLQWLSILGAWLALSFIIAAQRYAVSGPGDSSFAFLVYLFWSGAVWIYWALVAPLIFRLGRRIPLNRQSLSYALPAHFGLAALFGLSHLAFWAALGTVFSGMSSGGAVGFRDEFVRLAQFLPYVEVIFYWAILGAGIAEATYRQARAGAGSESVGSAVAAGAFAGVADAASSAFSFQCAEHGGDARSQRRASAGGEDDRRTR